ncbi:BON domain-containing protein [Nonomuraea sp. NBC_01738]|uniref:BON domain-containing protein n=1 Tax=Nonomuraea sp. NBC_01738 TaxID=2976003 RepID=UPI002E0D3565
MSVEDGVVTLTGRLARHSEANLAARHAESVDGVVAVHEQLSWKDDDVLPPFPTWGVA